VPSTAAVRGQPIMTKIACENCGRKVTVDREGQESRAPMKYCRRCGEELPPHDER
jgi:DNA replicative helicase MCM subunit Mcm2 (Cdc46/Mcm family)